MLKRALDVTILLAFTFVICFWGANVFYAIGYKDGYDQAQKRNAEQNRKSRQVEAALNAVQYQPVME